jgi:hypothetical protein
MMKVILRTAVVFGVVGMLASLPAGAFCSLPSTFTSNYIQGTNEDNTAVLGTFWGLGQHNPAEGLGHDSTGFPAADWVRATPGSGIYLAGDWAGDVRIDGCVQDPPNPQPAKMAFVLSAPGAAPGSTVYAAGCGVEDVGGNFFFLAGGNAPGAPLPKPQITASSRPDSSSVQITVDPPTLGGGIFDEGACSLGITGYRVYTRNVPRNAAAPADRVRSNGWVAAGPASPTASQSTMTIPCSGNEDVYVAYTLVFTDGIELEHVGANSTVVQCGATTSNPPSNFKIIKKPIRTKTE